MDTNDWLLYVGLPAAVVYPLWRVFVRVGLNPAVTLFVFIPLIGWWIVGLVLAYSKWPALELRRGSK